MFSKQPLEPRLEEGAGSAIDRRLLEPYHSAGARVRGALAGVAFVGFALVGCADVAVPALPTELYAKGGVWRISEYEIAIATNGNEEYRRAYTDAGTVRFWVVEDFGAPAFESDWDEEFAIRRPDAIRVNDAWQETTLDAWGRYWKPHADVVLAFENGFDGGNSESIIVSERETDRIVGTSVVETPCVEAIACYATTRSYVLVREVP